ncbi:MAG: DUF4279 domain-containing protein [Planctomycetes bacterium]|nr:DUF4279 domain-containing protein [Planctomycetota bacterium]
MTAGALPNLPLSRLRCSNNDLVRALVERQPAWGHASPGRVHQDGDRGVTSYRLQPDSFFLEVQWRRTGERWDERELTVVPGAVVGLRLVLDDVPPDRITRALDLAPTRAFAKGESGPHGRHVRDEGLWIHEVLPRGFHWPEEKVAELLALLRARSGWRDVAAMRGVTWAGVTVQLRGCVERMGGFAIEPRVLEDLVGLSLQLDVQLFAE